MGTGAGGRSGWAGTLGLIGKQMWKAKDEGEDAMSKNGARLHGSCSSEHENSAAEGICEFLQRLVGLKDMFTSTQRFSLLLLRPSSPPSLGPILMGGVRVGQGHAADKIIVVRIA